MGLLRYTVTYNPVVFFLLVLALSALLIWAAVKIVSLYRKGGEPGRERDETDTDGRSVGDRVTNFLNYPWS